MGVFLHLFFGYFFIVAAFFFSVMTFSYSKKVFFFIGIGCLALSSFSVINELEMYYSSILNANLVSIGFALAWFLSIIFLILSQIKKNSDGSEPVTQQFLDSIIQGEDEEWDPES